MHYREKISREQMLIMSFDAMITLDDPVRLIDLFCKKVLVEQPFNDKWKFSTNEGRNSSPPDSILELLVNGYFNGITRSRKPESETYRNI